MATQMNLF